MTYYTYFIKYYSKIRSLLTYYTVTCIIDIQMGRQPNHIKWNKESIRALRSHLNVTQTKLAEELGTRQQTISEWETGMYKPRGASAKLLTIVAERSSFKYKYRELLNHNNNDALLSVLYRKPEIDKP